MFVENFKPFSTAKIVTFVATLRPNHAPKKSRFKIPGSSSTSRHHSILTWTWQDTRLKVVQYGRAEAKGDVRRIFDVARRCRNSRVGRPACKKEKTTKHKKTQTTKSRRLRLSKRPARATSRLRPCNFLPSVSMSSSYALLRVPPPSMSGADRNKTKQNTKKSSLGTAGESSRTGVWNFNCERFCGEATAFRFWFPDDRREGTLLTFSLSPRRAGHVFMKPEEIWVWREPFKSDYFAAYWKQASIFF